MLLTIVLYLAVVSVALSHNPDLDEAWKTFKSVHGKRYSQKEDFTRRQIWEDHLCNIRKHNLEYDLGLHTFWLGINEYSDMTHKEFVSTMNGYLHNSSLEHTAEDAFMPKGDKVLASSVDWRKQGYVTGVKNQGQCGSCWAFSATGTLEGQHYKKTHQLTSLSEQQLVDCAKSAGNGCQGGHMYAALTYIQKNGGIDTESSYPYKGRDGTCQFKKSSVGATDRGYKSVSRSEQALAQAVASVGPISVGIDASHSSFQHYRGGIYNEPSCSSSRLDHGVLVVGYGDGYWLVKNSWGRSWGSSGYIEMTRGKNNQCGIASSAVYPVV